MERIGPPIEVLLTPRLVLRPIVPEDKPTILQLCSPIEVAQQTLSFPHPYTPDDADQFLERVRVGRETGTKYVWAITLATAAREPGEHIGTVGAVCEWPHLYAEVGYVLGVPHWGKGYATEALRAVVRFAFTRTPLVRLNAGFYSRNAASGRVLEKCGFTREGLRPSMYERFGRRVDIALMGLLKDNWVDRSD